MAGAVASAVRYIGKAILKGDNLSEIPLTSKRALKIRQQVLGFLFVYRQVVDHRGDSSLAGALCKTLRTYLELPPEIPPLARTDDEPADPRAALSIGKPALAYRENERRE